MSDFFEKVRPQERLKVDSVGDVFDNLQRMADGDGVVTFTKKAGKQGERDETKSYPLWKDNLGNVSVANRITKFMGDERGIAYIPSGGDRIALRESVVAGIFNTSSKIDDYVNAFTKYVAIVEPGQEIDSTGKPVRITVNAGTGYITSLVLDIKQLSGQDEFNPKDGLRVSQIEPVLAACKVNEETCRRNEQGVGMEKLVPKILVIDSKSQYIDVKVGVPLLQKNSVI